jgi:hypothetical protein
METGQRQSRDLRDVHSREFDGERFRAQALSMTGRTFGADQKLQNSFASQCALGVCEGMKKVAANSRESSLIARLLLSFECPACFFGSESGINRNGRLVFGE